MIKDHISICPKIRWSLITSFLIILTFSSCRFAYKKHVTGPYYIIAVDTKEDKSLTYSLSSGDYIGKAPGTILEYGYNDSLLVAKTAEYNRSPSYYILNMKKDFNVALEENFRTGPISESDYNQLWKSKLNISLVQVEN